MGDPEELVSLKPENIREPTAEYYAKLLSNGGTLNEEKISDDSSSRVDNSYSDEPASGPNATPSRFAQGDSDDSSYGRLKRSEEDLLRKLQFAERLRRSEDSSNNSTSSCGKCDGSGTACRRVKQCRKGKLDRKDSSAQRRHEHTFHQGCGCQVLRLKRENSQSSSAGCVGLI